MIQRSKPETTARGSYTLSLRRSSCLPFSDFRMKPRFRPDGGFLTVHCELSTVNYVTRTICPRDRLPSDLCSTDVRTLARAFRRDAGAHVCAIRLFGNERGRLTETSSIQTQSTSSQHNPSPLREGQASLRARGITRSHRPPPPAAAELPKSSVGFAISPCFVADAPQLSPVKGGRSEQTRTRECSQKLLTHRPGGRIYEATP